MDTIPKSTRVVEYIKDTATKEDCRDKCLENDKCEIFLYTAEGAHCILGKMPTEKMVPLPGLVTGRRENCD